MLIICWYMLIYAWYAWYCWHWWTWWESNSKVPILIYLNHLRESSIIPWLKNNIATSIWTYPSSLQMVDDSEPIWMAVNPSEQFWSHPVFNDSLPQFLRSLRLFVQMMYRVLRGLHDAAKALPHGVRATGGGWVEMTEGIGSCQSPTTWWIYQCWVARKTMKYTVFQSMTWINYDYMVVGTSTEKRWNKKIQKVWFTLW